MVVCPYIAYLWILTFIIQLKPQFSYKEHYTFKHYCTASSKWLSFTSTQVSKNPNTAAKAPCCLNLAQITSWQHKQHSSRWYNRYVGLYINTATLSHPSTPSNSSLSGPQAIHSPRKLRMPHQLQVTARWAEQQQEGRKRNLYGWTLQFWLLEIWV